MAENIVASKIIGRGIVSGNIKKVSNPAEAQSITEQDIVFSDNLSPPLASLMRKAAGFVLVGNEANHTVVYLREIWKPGLIVHDNQQFQEGQKVTLDCNKGMIFFDDTVPAPETIVRKKEHHSSTKVYLQLGVPRMASEAAKLGAEGITLFRSNLVIQEEGKHPDYYFKNGKEKELETILANGIKKICQEFYPKPVWMRTMDFDSSELQLYEGGENEVKENNPYLGLRGLARELRDEHMLRLEFEAIKEAIKEGYDNLGVIFPLVRDIKEYHQAKEILHSVGLTPHQDLKVGVVFETPSACLQINEFINSGIDLAFIGINDITQYTLASDRTNNEMSHLYNPLHPSVIYLVKHVLTACKKARIETTMNFLPPLKKIFPELINCGLSSVTLQAQQIHSISKVLSELETNGSV
tara:strand:+ start:576 stop:1808 length:1233 start_codon:yes stop_codon:yes gene_type:complete